MDRIKWVDQRLSDWARWIVGGSEGYGGGTMFNPNRVDHTADNRAGMRNLDPAFDDAALLTDRAIAHLASDLKRTVIAAYTGDGGNEVIAQRLGITRATLHRRLCVVDRLIEEFLTKLHERKKEIQAA